MISQEEKEKIIQQLSERIPFIKCPMCGETHFIVTDGYFINFMQENLSEISIGGPSIPAISIVCKNCGFVSQHALGVLGLLPNQSQQEGGEDGK